MRRTTPPGSDPFFIATSFSVMHRWFGTEPSETVQLERRSHSSGNDADTSALQLPERFVVPFLTGTLDEKEFVRNVHSIQVREHRRSLQFKKEGYYKRN